MGIHHLRCAVSGLGIVTEPVVLVFIAKHGEHFVPIAPPIAGDYDSYGSIELEHLHEVASQVLTGLLALRERGELVFAAADNPVGHELSVANLRAVIEEVRQGAILASVGDPALLVRVGGMELGFVMVLDRIYDAVVSTARTDELEEQLDEADFATLVTMALGAPAIASSLVADVPEIRTALEDLVMFRSWFDRARAFTPGAVGSQFSGRELEQQVARAKVDLAAWPELVAAVEAYQRRSLRMGGDT